MFIKNRAKRRCKRTIAILTATALVSAGSGLGEISFTKAGLSQKSIVKTMESFGDYTYYVSKEEGTAEITGYHGAGGDVIIPSEIEGYLVTSIGYQAFEDCSSLTSIEIPTGVTDIGSYAFYGCSRLTGIEIPNSVTSIGEDAFRECSRLTGIEIPDSVTVIGDSAFLGCSSLTNIEIPNSITSIGDYMFLDCRSLTGIEISNSVTSIGYNAFGRCSSLTSVEIPNSVTSIGALVFMNCSSLTRINIPNSVTSIGTSVFEGCTSLTSIEIPDSITSIGDRLFWGCSSLMRIKIPNSVTSIGDSAFWGCSSLMRIEIPNSVTSIGEYVFDECDSLTIYGYTGSYAETYAKDENIPFASLESAEKDIPKKNTVLTDTSNKCKVKVSSASAKNPTVTYVKSTNTKATGITIPATVTIDKVTYKVTSVAAGAFSDNKKLTKVTIGKNITTIDKNAFMNCTKLKNIVIKSGSIKTVGKNALKGTNKKLIIKVPAKKVSAYKKLFKGKGNTKVTVKKS